MYTIQALWTQRREGLDVTTIVFANRRYQILNNESVEHGCRQSRTEGARTHVHRRPELDFVALAKGMGVPGRRVANAEDFASALEAAMASAGPKLIEVQIGRRTRP